MTTGHADASILVPIVILALGSMAILVIEVLGSRLRSAAADAQATARLSTALAAVASACLLAAMFVARDLLSRDTVLFFTAQRPVLLLDSAGAFAWILLGITALLTVWLSLAYLPAMHIDHGEVYALLLFSLTGAFVAVSAFNLMSLFLGLELMSLPLYALVGFDRRRLKSGEAGLKVFLTGAFSSAVLLYGMALLYGATGALDFTALRVGFDPSSRLALAGMALMMAGLAFKIAAVPFHQWAPDVCEGAPTTVAGFMFTVFTTTTFFVLLRLTTLVLPEAADILRPVFAVLAVLGMVVGSLMSLIQTNVKRMLAYSGIAHVGVVLCGFAVGSEAARSAMMFQLTSLIFMHLGVFGALAAMARADREWDRVNDFAGLARSRPVLAAVVAFFMLALAGIPGTAGFMARFGMVNAVIESDHMGLALAIVLSAVLLFASYLRIPTLMYMREGAQPSQIGLPVGAVGAIGLCAFAVLYLGLFPSHGPLEFDLLEITRQAARSIW